MKELTLEQARAELIKQVDAIGGDYKAEALLKKHCWGYSPSHSTFNRIRRGEGKPSMIYMSLKLLMMIKNKE